MWDDALIMFFYYLDTGCSNWLAFNEVTFGYENNTVRLKWRYDTYKYGTITDIRWEYLGHETNNNPYPILAYNASGYNIAPEFIGRVGHVSTQPGDMSIEINSTTMDEFGFYQVVPVSTPSLGTCLTELKVIGKVNNTLYSFHLNCFILC